MAEEEMDFEADDMQVDEGSMLRAHSLVNAQLLRMWLKKKETQLLALRPTVANKMQAAFFMSSQQINSGPTHKSVDRRGGDSSVFLEELERMKLTDIFANESSMNVFCVS